MELKSASANSILTISELTAGYPGNFIYCNFFRKIRESEEASKSKFILSWLTNSIDLFHADNYFYQMPLINHFHMFFDIDLQFLYPRLSILNYSEKCHFFIYSWN